MKKLELVERQLHYISVFSTEERKLQNFVRKKLKPFFEKEVFKLSKAKKLTMQFEHFVDDVVGFRQGLPLLAIAREHQPRNARFNALLLYAENGGLKEFEVCVVLLLVPVAVFALPILVVLPLVIRHRN